MDDIVKKLAGQKGVVYTNWTDEIKKISPNEFVIGNHNLGGHGFDIKCTMYDTINHHAHWFVEFGKNTVGNKFVHGGAIAAMLDTIMGQVIWNDPTNNKKDHLVTVNLNVNYKLPVYPNTVYHVISKKLDGIGRRIIVHGEIIDITTGRTFATSNGTMIKIIKSSL